MDNFGVIEIASTTTKTTPGWAYVPDTGPAVPAALQPTNRKRAARNQPALSLSDLSAREETRLRKELEALDRESHRDVSIPIPPRPGRAQTKHTPNVRKILQSQKTFANHLDDFQAMLALAESNPAAAAAMAATQAKASTPSAAASKSASPAPTAASTTGANSGTTASKRAVAAAKRAAAKEKQEQERKKARQTPKKSEPPEESQPPPPADVEMTDAAPPQQPPEDEGNPQTYPRESQILPPYARPPPRPHPGDNDPLLISRVPPFPSDDELRALMTAPPLNYLEARATWDGSGDGTDVGDQGSRYPVRVFCAVCGYWGRVKCMKCGTRVCALECLETHREECITRYGL
ncbi:hypothetical protein VTJ49DRAFT_5441 [Mycothermus thermophilus]|uniref:HIT-type domain-containing protein n=1 Tax=Humicola insolens TaxID=85995 RepID=A0ABR3VKU7_HUMIN